MPRTPTSSQVAARSATIAALMQAMRETSGLGVMFSQSIGKRLGISGSDLECLDFVVLRGPVTAGELAAVTGLTTGAITGLIDRLEQAGLGTAHTRYGGSAKGPGFPTTQHDASGWAVVPITRSGNGGSAGQL